MKFILEIELGSNGVITGDDVALALDDARQWLLDDDEPLALGTRGTINSPDDAAVIVGKWEVAEV